MAEQRPHELFHDGKPTSHKYEPLPRDCSAVRLLHCRSCDICNSDVLHFVFSNAELAASSQEQVVKHPFYAASYTWGKDLVFAAIVLDGASVLIPASAEATLRGILSIVKNAQYTVLPLWIDAVCINQNDISEKETQIALMGKLYSQAATVFAWLGSDGGTTWSAVENLKQLAEYESQQEINSDDEGPMQEVSKPDVRNDVLQTFLSCSWFTRLWVVQEAILGRRTVLVRGDHSIPWDRFVLAVRGLEGTDGDDSAFEATVMRIWHFTESSDDFSLTRLLTLAHQFDTTNPSDKIYAILGLVDYTVDEEGHNPVCDAAIVPDYSKPLVDVYREATWLAIRLKGSLEPLQYSQMFNPVPEELLEDWPSWVPRYHDTGSHSVATDSFADRQHFVTCPDKEGWHSISGDDDPMIIRVLGLQVDKIKTVHVKNLADKDQLDSFLRGLWSRNHKWCPADIESLTMAITLRDCEPELCRALCSLVLLSRTSITAQNDQSHMNYILAYGDSEDSHEKAQWIRDIIEENATSAHSLVQLNNGTFARTFSFIRPGDQICILYAAWYPVVLRPVGRFWKLRGAARIGQIMEYEYLKKLRDEGLLAAETVEFAIS